MNGNALGRVLVIGGSRGTGMLIARRLRETGARVRVLARDAPTARAQLGPSIEVVAGDLTHPETLEPAMIDVNHIVFTAGARSGRYAPEALVKATDYQGVLDTLAFARSIGLRGRFAYLNSIGIATPSLEGTLLNLLKRNTLVWRRRVEDAIRTSGLDYSIIRVGFLVDRPAGQRAIALGRGNLPLSWRHRIARGDVADAFVEALQHPHASRQSFEIVWDRGPRQRSWTQLLDSLANGTSRSAQRAH
jgi:uncharacterized protein YbjT (DUF2867 family)